MSDAHFLAGWSATENQPSRAEYFHNQGDLMSFLWDHRPSDWPDSLVQVEGDQATVLSPLQLFATTQTQWGD